MPRRPIEIGDFTKGTTLKSEMLGGYGFPRVQNWKIIRAGVIRRRGGWDDWDTGAQDYGRIGGLKRWYREDRNRTFIFVASISGGTLFKIWEYTLSNKTVTPLLDITESSVDLDAPVLFVDCESVLVIMPLQSKGAPWSLRLNGTAGLFGMQLGLTPPITAPQAIPSTPKFISGLDYGDYYYVFTRGYGSSDNPFKYGESAPSLATFVRILDPGLFDPNMGRVDIDVLESFSGTGIVQAFRIYRTKQGGSTFYRVGEITQANHQTFIDVLNDSLIDESRVLPIFTGAPPLLLCGTWHDNRFWGFGADGELHISAGGHPDIYPATYRSVIGKKGYVGNGVVVLRGNKYALKEDGVFIITGTVPNIGYRKVDDTGCFSRGSVAVVGDDIYFLGVGTQGAGVYRFDGNVSILVDHQISEITRRHDPYFFKKAYGRKVKDEYWLSIICDDPRYVGAPVPFNNVLCIYDTKYKFWDTFQGQASAIECFDGPGDNQEVFITEADAAANTTGTFFRFNANSGVGPQTTYPNGVRTYSKTTPLPSRLAVGALKEARFPLDPTQPHALSVMVRGMDGSIPLSYYNNLNLTQATIYNPELNYRTYNLANKYKWGLATFGTGSEFFNLSVLDRYEYTLKDIQFPHGIFLEPYFNTTTGLTPELEGMEYLYDWTNPEGKNG